MRYFAVMDSATWAAIAAWVGVGITAVFAIRAERSARESGTHEQAAAASQREAAKAQIESAEAAGRLADLEAMREAERHAAAKIAKMAPELSSKGRSSGYYQLIVTNSGPAKAENLRIWLGEDLDPKGHFDQVEPGSPASISLAATVPGGKHPPYLVKLTWSDGRGPDQVWGPQLVYDLGE